MKWPLVWKKNHERILGGFIDQNKSLRGMIESKDREIKKISAIKLSDRLVVKNTREEITTQISTTYQAFASIRYADCNQEDIDLLLSNCAEHIINVLREEMRNARNGRH